MRFSRRADFALIYDAGLSSESMLVPCQPARRRSQYCVRRAVVIRPAAPLPSGRSLTRVTGTIAPAVVDRKASLACISSVGSSLAAFASMPIAARDRTRFDG